MTARTHDLAAIVALGGVLWLHPIGQVTLATALVAIFANQVGGIAPDIDQPTAPFWRNLPIGGLIGRIIDFGLGGHRFLSHSLLGVGIFGVLTYALLHIIQPIMPHVNVGYVWWAFMIGFVSHLVMDTFTKEGVPWFLPVPVHLGLPPIKSLRVTTGKFVEKGIVFPAMLGLTLWFCVSHYVWLAGLVHQSIVR